MIMASAFPRFWRACHQGRACHAAYRRAEQAERNAMARARKLREQLNLLCEQSKDRYLDAGEEISALSSDLSAGLTRLSETLADIQVIFDDAENAFDELQLPEEE